MLSRRTLLAASLATPGLAQGGYPTRPIRLLVGYPPAGTTDIAARIAAEHLAPRLGQPGLGENRPGATGNIAAEQAARAEPDGYTLLTSNIATTAINYSLFGP